MDETATRPTVPSLDDLTWYRRPRWRYALAAFLLGVAESALGLGLGFRATLGTRDVTFATAVLIEVSFGVFGYWIGVAVEGRRLARLQNAALVKARSRLARAETLASLGELASTIAHEVRNPLAILRSLAQNLSEDACDRRAAGRAGVEPARVEETCRALVEEIDRLARVTGRLSDFARPPMLERSRARAGDVVARVAGLAARLLEDGPSRLVVEKPLAAAEIEVDLELVCQVLLGLVANAAEACAAGTTIRLGCARGGSPSEIQLFVADRGPGVPSDLRERIFEPFFTTRRDGHGLGLAVARQIVEAHGGRIAVVDEAPRGARFEVTLPVVGDAGRAP